MTPQKPSKEILDQVRSEISEHLSAIESLLLELDDDPSNLEKVNELFRRMHTIKGLAPVLENSVMVEISHRTESFLEKLRESKKKLSAEDLDLLLLSRDLLTKSLRGESVDFSQFKSAFGLTAEPAEPKKVEPKAKTEEAPAAPAEEEVAEVNFLLFYSGGHLAAFSLDRIREVSGPLTYRQLPFTGSATLGVASLRGQLVTILDLAILLDLPKTTEGKGRILFIESGEELIGCWVDRVLGVAPLAGWEKSVSALRHFGLDLVEGVSPHRGEVVSILSPDKLFELAQ